MGLPGLLPLRADGFISSRFKGAGAEGLANSRVQSLVSLRFQKGPGSAFASILGRGPVANLEIRRTRSWSQCVLEPVQECLG